MNMRFVARELAMLAKELLAVSPMLKRDTTPRNQSQYDMVTTYAVRLYNNAVNKGKELMKTNGFAFTGNPEKLNTLYLAYHNAEANNNKYHYYVLLKFGDKYMALNSYGRIGFIEATQLLGKKIYDDRQHAEAAMMAHFNSKLRKGYTPVKLTRG